MGLALLRFSLDGVKTTLLKVVERIGGLCSINQLTKVSRTTKRANTNKVGGTPNTGDATLNKRMKDSISEKNFQVKLERMQLDLASKKFTLPAIAQGALDELTRIKKVRHELGLLRDANGQKIKIVSVYITLLELYNRDLASLEDNDFGVDADIKAAKLCASCKGEITAEQQDVIIRWYHTKAAVLQGAVKRVKNVLILNDMIKATEAEKAEAEQAEAEAEKKVVQDNA